MRTLLVLALLATLGACRDQEVQGPPPADHGARPDENADPLGAHLFDLGQERVASYTPEGDAPLRGTLSRGQVQDHPVVLIGTRCYVAVATAAEGAEELDLTLIDPHGATMLRDETTGRDAAFGLRHAVCPMYPGSYRIRVRMTAGEGEYVLHLYGNDIL